MAVLIKTAIYGWGRTGRFSPERLFRLKVFNMLKKEGKINGAIIENILTWHHSGFNVYCGESIWPSDQGGD